MFEQGVTQNLAFRIETYQHLQVAAKAHRGTFDSCSEVLSLSILDLIDDIGKLLTIDILFNLYRVGNN